MSDSAYVQSFNINFKLLNFTLLSKYYKLLKLRKYLNVLP